MIFSLKLDLATIRDVDGLHEAMRTLFGFPGFYGGNYPALVDCLSSLRYPDDGMTAINLKASTDVIGLEVKGLSTCSREVAQTLLSAVEAVNQRLMDKQLNPSIHLILTR